MPIGSVMWFAGDTAPDDHLICDGAEISTSTYADLFGVIGYDYGGAGVVFALPDLRNKFGAGAGDDFDLASEGGEATHALSVAELPSHQHQILKGEASGSFVPGAQQIIRSDGNYFLTDTSGSNFAHNNLPPYVALTPIIKAL